MDRTDPKALPERASQAGTEDRFRHLIENIQEYVFIFMDAHGIIDGWNAGARAVFGYSAEEATGQHFRLIFLPEDIALDLPGAELAKALSSGKAVDERWHLRADGSRLWASGFTVPLYAPDGSHTGFAKIARDATARKVEQMEREALLMQVQDALVTANREHQAAEAARAEAEAAHREADAANLSKDQFINQVAHEIRTPLDAIQLWSHLLQNESGAVDPSQGLAAINRGAQSIQSLIDDLLDSVRGRTGKLTLELSRLDLGRLVEQTLDDFRPSIASNGLTLEFEPPAESLEMVGDARRLHQVIANLMANSIKFTPKGGRIQVHVSGTDEEREIMVRDTGQGFIPSFASSIFEPYSQESRTGEAGGLGLGLYIVRSLVELHGGTVQAHSEGPDQGARFTVCLPAAVHTQHP